MTLTLLIKEKLSFFLFPPLAERLGGEFRQNPPLAPRRIEKTLQLYSLHKQRTVHLLARLAMPNHRLNQSLKS